MKTKKCGTYFQSSAKYNIFRAYRCGLNYANEQLLNPHFLNEPSKLNKRIENYKREKKSERERESGKGMKKLLLVFFYAMNYFLYTFIPSLFAPMIMKNHREYIFVENEPTFETN